MDKIQLFKERIETLIENYNFSGTPKELYDPIVYTMKQKGKRLRPLLCMLACDLFGGDVKKVEYPALAAEVFHNFTLIHDDIMDRAPLRRGVETVYKKWNQDIAILAGDTMFAMAYQLAMQTDYKNIRKVLNTLSRVAIQVCEGQQLDLNFEQQENVSIADYLEMIRLKTAVLLGGSLEIGATIANVDDTTLQAIYEFGVTIGIAFQLQDDLLDVYGNYDVFGKITGGDITTNKKTYLYLQALEVADDATRQQLLDFYSDNYPLHFENKIQEVTAIFNKLGVKELVEQVMNDYYNKGIERLNRISVSEDKKETLLKYVNILYSRDH
ncbi:MAG: polyprenyl synthetase family protein [Lentimicrobiaceae bacterium]|jgi:geranylgeranyl diphosphate synthase type II|nr:polyprenyl synthetase family protein [Lentimicrobiaceae bacterium]